MPNIVVRPFDERDRDGFNHVRSVAYRDGKAVPEHENLIAPDSSGFVGEVDGEIAGAFTVLDMTATRGPATLRCGGVCAVGVPPERRRSGVGGAMMVQGLQLMRDAGYAVASLYAYRESYYRKFGYECCGASYQILCPMDRLPGSRSGLHTAQLRPEDFERIRAPYLRFAHRYSGMNTREHERFWPDAAAEKPWTVYVAGEPIEAYAVVRLDSAFWTEQRVRELVWLSPQGYEALMDLFRGIAINKSAVRWDEPSDSPFVGSYMDYGIDVRLRRPVMYRVLDVARALECLQPEGAGAFTMRISDELVPENAGTWLVEFQAGKVSVERTGEQPDVEMDVRRLVQALLGAPSLTDLFRLGYASAQRAERAEAATRMLPPSHTTCLEAF